MDEFPDGLYSYDEQVRQFPEYTVLLQIVQGKPQSDTSQQEDTSIKRISETAPPPIVPLDAVVEQLVALTRQAAVPTLSSMSSSSPAQALHDHVWRTACSMAMLVKETDSADMQQRLVDFVFKIEAVEVRVGGDEDETQGKPVVGGLDMYSGPVWTGLPFLNYNFFDDLLREGRSNERLCTPSSLYPTLPRGRRTLLADIVLPAPPLDVLPEESKQWENQAVFMGLYNNSLLSRHRYRLQTKTRQTSANLTDPAAIDPNKIPPLPRQYGYFIDRHLSVLDAAFSDPWSPQAARNTAQTPNGSPKGPNGCTVRAACLFTIYGGAALWEYTEIARARKREEDDCDDGGGRSGSGGNHGSGDEKNESENEDEAEEGFKLEPVQDARVPIVMARWARWKQEFRIARVMYNGDQLDRTLELVEQTLDEMDRLDGGHGS